MASLARLKAYARVGKTPSVPLDFPHLFGASAHTVPLLDSCGKISYTTSLRVRHAMVWFSVFSEVDKYALDLLRNGDIVSAQEIFDSRKDEYSAGINSAVLDFCKGDTPSAVAKILGVIRTDGLREQFVSVLSPYKYFTESDLLLMLIETLAESFTYDDISLWFSGYPLASDLLNNRFRQMWQNEINMLQHDISLAAANNIDSIITKVNRIKYLLEWLDQTASHSDPAVLLLHDSVARTILERIINLYNAGGVPVTRPLLNLLREASTIAYDTSLKARCRDNYTQLLKTSSL